MIRHSKTGTVISETVVEARHLFTRMRGMLGRDFSTFDAMLFRHNNSIHMFFIKMPMDIVFLDKADVVTGFRCCLPPWHMAGDLKASSVIELPAGTLEAAEIEVGNHLEIVVDQIM